MKRLQALYDSEINFSIASFWDAGFECKLGDDTNGFVEKFWVDTIEEAICGLVNDAKEKYPKSKFSTGLLWNCKYCGENEFPKCHMCIQGDGKNVTDGLVS